MGRDLGDESSGVSEAPSQERRMLRMICGVTLKDMVESTVIASRVGVNDLEEHLRQKRLRWFGHIARRDEEVEIKKVFELKIEGRRKRSRPVKRWSDVVEEDMKKRAIVQQDAGIGRVGRGER